MPKPGVSQNLQIKPCFPSLEHLTLFSKLGVLFYLCQSGKRPANAPTAPQKVHKHDGWQGCRSETQNKTTNENVGMACPKVGFQRRLGVQASPSHARVRRSDAEKWTMASVAVLLAPSPCVVPSTSSPESDENAGL